jgi:hypothetical protein
MNHHILAITCPFFIVKLACCLDTTLELNFNVVANESELFSVVRPIFATVFKLIVLFGLNAFVNGIKVIKKS